MQAILFNKRKNNKGFTIIEIIIACTIISITVLALLSTAQKGIELSGRALRQAQANNLLEEGVEAVKIIRDNDWNNINNLVLDTDYYLFFNLNTNTWSLSSSIDTPTDSIPSYPIDDIFTRKIVFSSTERDSSDDIVLSDGDVDDRTKKVTVSVSWLSPTGQVEKDLVFYLMDIFN